MITPAGRESARLFLLKALRASKMDRLHQHSATGKILAGKYSETKRMIRSPAYAWFDSFKEDSEHDVMEDSCLVRHDDQTITLLWLKDDLDD